MSWNTFTLTVPEQLKDIIVSEFFSDEIAGVWEREVPGSEEVELVLYFEAENMPPQVDTRIGSVLKRNGYEASGVILGFQEEEDWILNSRDEFSGFCIGNSFEVIPSWENILRTEDRIPIRIDPGLAFGTGTHETTRLMLEILEVLDLADGIVLDLGSGSAILAIAATKLGHSRVIACDIDSDAVQVARENLVRNSSDVSIFLGSVDSIRSRSVKLVLANLTAEVISTVLPEIVRIVQAHGIMVFSGILDVQTDQVVVTVSCVILHTRSFWKKHTATAQITP